MFSKLLKKIEYLFFIIVAIGGIAISLLSFFNFLSRWPWMANRIPILNLLIISSIVIKLLMEKTNSCERIVSTLFDIEKGQLAKIEYMVDPKLRLVFGKQIKDYIKNLDLAINQKQIIFNDIKEFRYFYKLALEKHHSATFFATSIPSKNYFWKNKLTEDSMRNFIKNGGSLKRIYFLDCELADANDEVLEILSFQLNIGIEVYVITKDKMPKNLIKLIALESTEQIGWEVYPGSTNEINQVIVSSDPNVIKEYNHIFARIRELPDTKKISKEEINILAKVTMSSL